MSSTFIKTNDTLLEENDKSKDDKILEERIGSSDFLPTSNPNHSLFQSNEENGESISDSDSNLEKKTFNNEYLGTTFTLGEVFGLSSSFSSGESITEGKEKEISKSSIFSPTQNTLTSTSESIIDSISIEDIFGMSSTFIPTNGEEKDKAKYDKNQIMSQSNIEQETSIEDIVELSSSYLPKDKLHEENRGISDHSSHSEEKNIEEEYPDRQITLGQLFGLSSSFSSKELAMEGEEKQIPESSNYGTTQNTMTSTSENMDDSRFIEKAIEDMDGLSSSFLTVDKLYEDNTIEEEYPDGPITLGKFFGLSNSLSTKDSVNDGEKREILKPSKFSPSQNSKSASKDEFGISTTITPTNDIYMEEKGIPKKGKIFLHSQANIEQATSIENEVELSSSFLPADNLPITIGEMFGLSSSFSSVEESVFEEKDDENMTQFDKEEPAFENSLGEKKTYNSKMTAPWNDDILDTSIMSTEKDLPNEKELLSVPDNLGLSFEGDFEKIEEEEKAIQKEDILKIESPKNEERKHKINMKSPDVAGLFKSIFSPMSKLLKNSNEEMGIFTTHVPITYEELESFEGDDLKTPSSKETDEEEDKTKDMDPLLSAKLSKNNRPTLEKEDKLLTTHPWGDFSNEEHFPLLASELSLDTMTDKQSNVIIEAETDKVESHEESLPPPDSSDQSKLLVKNYEEKNQEQSNLFSTETEIHHTSDEEEEISSHEAIYSSLSVEASNLIFNGKNIVSDESKSSGPNNREEKQDNYSKKNEVESIEENFTASKTFEAISYPLNQDVITSDEEGMKKIPKEYDSAQIGSDATSLQVSKEHSITGNSDSLPILLGHLEETSNHNVLTSEESEALIENLGEKAQEESNVMSIEMHPKPMYLAQQNAKEESSEHNEESSAETFGKGINKEKVRKNYSLEVLFLEEDKASIDIDYPESISIENSSQESQSESINSPIFYIKQNNNKSSDSGISYQPMFNTSNSKNPWYKKFEFFCVGKNVLMVLKRRKSIEE